MWLLGLWTLVKKKITKHKISYIALWRTYRKIVKVFQWILPWSSSIPAGLWTASAILSKNTNININTEEIITKIHDEKFFIDLIMKLHKLFPIFFFKENFTYLCPIVERITHLCRMQCIIPESWRMASNGNISTWNHNATCLFNIHRTGTLFPYRLITTFFVYIKDFANMRSNFKRPKNMKVDVTYQNGFPMHGNYRLIA